MKRFVFEACAGVGTFLLTIGIFSCVSLPASSDVAAYRAKGDECIASAKALDASSPEKQAAARACLDTDRKSLCSEWPALSECEGGAPWSSK